MSFGRLYHVQCRFLVPSWSDVHTCCLHVPVYISACTKRNVLGGSVTAVVAAGVVVGVVVRVIIVGVVVQSYCSSRLVVVVVVVVVVVLRVDYRL